MFPISSVLFIKYAENTVNLADHLQLACLLRILDDLLPRRVHACHEYSVCDCERWYDSDGVERFVSS